MIASGRFTRRNNRPTLADITRPIPCTCATCGGPAVIQPYPNPIGSCLCVKCTPAWCVAFVTDMSAKLRSGELSLADRR